MFQPRRPIVVKKVQCNLCGSVNLKHFLNLPGMPAQDGICYASRELALSAPVGDIDLAFCPTCGYIGNTSFDPALINFQTYSYSQDHSPMYRAHVSDVVQRLVEREGFRNKRVIDVGCGSGHFLRELCDMGNNSGLGIDPSLTEHQDSSPNVQMIAANFDRQHVDSDYDLVICRHVLDELPDPMGFAKMLAGTSSPGYRDLVYLEFPNAWKTFQEKLVWNVGYAKNSWFTSDAITHLLQTCGLKLVWEAPLFNNEYIGVLAVRDAGKTANATSRVETADALKRLTNFAAELEREKNLWRERVTQLRQRGDTVALWGAGMRGINFLHTFPYPDVFSSIVDVNRERHGQHLPGSGFQIEAPSVLIDLAPEQVLVTNPNYVNEISRELKLMGLNSNVMLL